MNSSKGKTIAKKITAVVFMPLFIYLLMAIISGAKGRPFNIFEGDTVKNILQNSCYMALVALGIGFQLKYGRFDFSGGAIIIISALITAKFVEATNAPLIAAVLVSVLSGIGLSLLNSLIYIGFRVPISVISLATAYLFESFSGLITGTNSVPQMQYTEAYNQIRYFPLILIPLLIGIALYVVYGHFTVAGKQSKLLRENQKAAVNIGINEKKNTIITYVVSGVIFGLAAILYATSNTLSKVSSPLETAGTLFSNIVPSLVGLFLSRYIDDSAGTFIGALTITILYYGLDVMGIGSGIKTVCYSLFLAVFIFISGFWDQIWIFLRKNIEKIKNNRNKDSGDGQAITVDETEKVTAK
jgi:ribose transport system permease protein